MNRTRFQKALFAFAAGALLAAGQALATATVGEPAPNFSLKALDGKTYSLADFKGKTVVLEWINPNCPFSARQANDGVMTGVVKKHPEVVWLAINSTNPSHQDHLSNEEHLAWNKKHGVAYPVLLDGSGSVGHLYEAKSTPHMFIIDKQGKVAYNGAIDDDPRGSKAVAARVNYVDGGLVAELAGKSPDPATTRSYGCSIKY